MLFSNLPKPAIIAHRGASAYAPENTLAAFKLALEQGADAIELDAKLSADKQVVVIHDQTLNRTTPVIGRVRDFIMADMHKMDAGSHFDIAFRGEPIPSLDEVFKAVGLLTYINIELTNYATPYDKLPDRVVELVKRNKLQQRVFFSSFYITNLIRIRRLLPDVPVGLLLPSGWKGKLSHFISSGLLHYQSLHPGLRDVSLRLIKQTHKKGRLLFVYTVNQEEEMRKLFKIGADGLFTADPILARSVLAKVRDSATRNTTSKNAAAKDPTV
jgi:glycerophosphoryl diester phosphodiesterase